MFGWILLLLPIVINAHPIKQPHKCEFSQPDLVKGATIKVDALATISPEFSVIPSLQFDSRSPSTTYEYVYFGVGEILIIYENGSRVATFIDDAGELKIAHWPPYEKVVHPALNSKTVARKCRVALYTDNAFKSKFGSNYKNVIETHMRAADTVMKTTDFKTYQYGLVWDTTNVHVTNSPHSSVVSTIGWLATTHAGTSESGSSADVCVNLFFSGKSYDEKPIAGMAYKGVAGVAQATHNVALTSITHSQTLLFLAVTHELGHTWGMGHDTQSCGDSFLMWPILADHRTTFSQCSITAADQHLSGVSTGLTVTSLTTTTTTTKQPTTKQQHASDSDDSSSDVDVLIVVLGSLGGFLVMVFIIGGTMWYVKRRQRVGL